MNKAGGWLAALLVGAYLIFEVTHLQRFSYRMEPGYILDELVHADQAVRRCGGPSETERSRFLRNFEIMQGRALQALLEEDPTLAASEAQARLDEQIAATIQAVDAVVDEQGCKDGQVWRWQKLHSVRARLNLQPAAA